MTGVFVYYFLDKRYGSPMLVSQDILVPFRSSFRVVMVFGSGDVRNRDASGLCRHRKMPKRLESPYLNWFVILLSTDRLIK